MTQESVVHCQQCGRDNHPTAKYCTSCGEGLVLSCPQCQASFEKGQVYCSSCGYGYAQYCRACGTVNTSMHRFCMGCGISLQNPCPQCGRNLPKESKFCGYCAYQIVNICNHCGFSNLPGQTFCGACNKQLNIEVNLPQTTAPQPPSVVEAPPEIAHEAHSEPDREASEVSEKTKPDQISEARTPEQSTPPPERVTDASPLSHRFKRLKLGQMKRPLEAQAEVQKDSSVKLAPEQNLDVSSLANAEPSGFGEILEPSVATPESLAEHPQEESSPEIQPEPAWPELQGNFPLCSIELMNWAQVQTEISDQADFLQILSDTLNTQLLPYQATVETVRLPVIFVAFRKGNTVDEVLQNALNWAQCLVQAGLQIEEKALKLKVGIDLETVALRNPTRSVAERSIASARSVVVSETVHQRMASHFRFEAIGPVRYGNQMKTFYQVLKPLPDLGIPSKSDGLKSKSSSSEATINQPTSPKMKIKPKSTSAQGKPAAKKSQAIIQLPQLLGTGPARQPQMSYEQALRTLSQSIFTFLSPSENTLEADALGKVLHLVAPEGLGKSSMIRTALSQLSGPEHPQAYWLIANYFKQAQTLPVPLSGWIDMLQTSFGLTLEGIDPTLAKQALDHSLGFLYPQGAPPAEIRDFFEDLLLITNLEPISVTTSEKMERLENALLGLFKHLSADKPVVMILDDVEYADPSSLVLLARLIKKGLLALPICVVLTYTPSVYFDGELADALRMATSQELVVRPLSSAEGREFLAAGPLNLASPDCLPDTFITHLLERSRGLPLYWVEALRWLHGEGYLRLEGEQFILSALGKETLSKPELAQKLLPDTLHHLLDARMAQLSDMARYVLQLASVLGEKFNLAALIHLAGPAQDAQFKQVMQELFEQGWVLPDPANTARFVHPMLWQVAYDSIEDEMQTQLHKLMSEYLETAVEQHFTVFPGLAAYHSERGGLYKRAYQYWNLTGVYAAQLGFVPAISEAWLRAIELLPYTEEESPEQLACQLYDTLATLNLAEMPELSVMLFEKIMASPEFSEELSKRVELLGRLAVAYEHQGRYYEASQTLDEALQQIDPDQYPIEYATLLTNQLEYLAILGKYQQVLDRLESEVFPRFSGQREDETEYRVYLTGLMLKGKILLAQLDSQGFTVFQTAETVLDLEADSVSANQLQDMRLKLTLQQAEGLRLKGDYAGCQERLQSVLSEIEALEQADYYLAHWGLIALAYHCDLADWENAKLLIPHTLYQAEKAKDYLTWLLVTVYTGQVALGEGRLAEAKETFERAVALSADYRFAGVALQAWRLLAETELALLSKGSAQMALDLAEKALLVAEKPEIQNWCEAVQLRNVIANALLALDQSQTAGAQLEKNWALLKGVAFKPLVAETAEQVGKLYTILSKKTEKPETFQKYQAKAKDFREKARKIWLELGNDTAAERMLS